MRPSRRDLLLSLGAAPLLGACAGFRGGWESLPYVGDTPPAPATSRTPYEARERRTLTLPGLRLAVDLNNSLRSYDTQVWFFVVPVSVDPRTVPAQQRQAGRTRVSLHLTQLAQDLVFRPRQARLLIGAQVHAADSATQFGQWDAQGRRVEQGGRWEHRPVADELPLPKDTRSASLSLGFAVDTPAPESRELALDLGDALAAPSMPRLPLIRFVPVRWREGYT